MIACSKWSLWTIVEIGSSFIMSHCRYWSAVDNVVSGRDTGGVRLVDYRCVRECMLNEHDALWSRCAWVCVEWRFMTRCGVDVPYILCWVNADDLLWCRCTRELVLRSLMLIHSSRSWTCWWKRRALCHSCLSRTPSTYAPPPRYALYEYSSTCWASKISLNQLTVIVTFYGRVLCKRLWMYVICHIFEHVVLPLNECYWTLSDLSMLHARDVLGLLCDRKNERILVSAQTLYTATKPVLHFHV